MECLVLIAVLVVLLMYTDRNYYPLILEEVNQRNALYNWLWRRQCLWHYFKNVQMSQKLSLKSHYTVIHL